MSESLDVDIKFNASGNAGTKLREWGDEVKKFEALSQRAQAVGSSALEKKFSDQARLYESLVRTTESRLRSQRMQEEFLSSGLVAGPKTSEQIYQQRFQQRVASMAQRDRMERDLIAGGHKADPAIAKRQADEERVRAQYSAKQREAREKQQKEDQERRLGTFHAIAQGRAGMAAATMALGTGPAGIIGTVAQAVKSALQTGGEIANIQQHGLMSEQSKERATGRALGMGWAIDFIDAITGVTERLRKIREQDLPIGEMQVGAAAEIRRMRADMAFRQAGPLHLGLGLTAYASSGEIGAGVRGFHRQTAESERAFERYQVMRPLELQARRSQIEADAARRTADFAKRQADQAASGRVAAERNASRYGRVYRRPDGMLDYTHAAPPSGVANEAGFRLQGALSGADLRNRDREEIDLLNRAREAEVRAIEATNRANQDRTAMLRGELQLLEARERRQSGWAQAIGAMNPLERSSARLAAQAIRDTGNLQAVTPEQLELARRYNPALIRRLEEQAGERELMQSGELGREEGDNRSLRQLRERDIPNAAGQIEIKTNLDEAAMANAIAKSFIGMAERIGVLVNKAVEAGIQNLINKLLLQNVNRSAG